MAYTSKIRCVIHTRSSHLQPYSLFCQISGTVISYIIKGSLTGGPDVYFFQSYSHKVGSSAGFVSGKWTVGMKLEAIDRATPGCVAPASIGKSEYIL